MDYGVYDLMSNTYGGSQNLLKPVIADAIAKASSRQEARNIGSRKGKL